METKKVRKQPELELRPLERGIIRSPEWSFRLFAYYVRCRLGVILPKRGLGAIQELGIRSSVRRTPSPFRRAAIFPFVHESVGVADSNRRGCQSVIESGN